MLSHTQAKQIVDGLGYDPVTSLFLRAVSEHETNYGAGWKVQNVAWFDTPLIWVPGVSAPWNVGAITTAHPDALSFSHRDSKFSDKSHKVEQYVAWFAGDLNAKAGFARLGRTVLKAEVLAALETHDIQSAVVGMYDQHYFLGLHTHANPNGDRLNITDYYAAVAKAIAKIGKETGEVHPNVLPPKVLQ